MNRHIEDSQIKADAIQIINCTAKPQLKSRNQKLFEVIGTVLVVALVAVGGLNIILSQSRTQHSRRGYNWDGKPAARNHS